MNSEEWECGDDCLKLTCVFVNIIIYYRRIGQPAMKLLHALGDEAAGPGGVTRVSFVAGALREVSVGLCRGNFFMYRACLGMFAKSNGTGVPGWHECAHGCTWPAVECWYCYYGPVMDSAGDS
jgi:hypothetical protein